MRRSAQGPHSPPVWPQLCVAPNRSVTVSGNVSITLRGLGTLSLVTCGSRKRNEELSALTVQPDPKGMEEMTCRGSRLPPPFRLAPLHTPPLEAPLPGMRALGPEPQGKASDGRAGSAPRSHSGPRPTRLHCSATSPSHRRHAGHGGREETGGLPAPDSWALRV